MLNTNYEICGITFGFQAQQSLSHGSQSVLFEKSGNNVDVSVNISAVPSIEKNTAKTQGRAGEKLVWCDDSVVFRMTHDRFRKEPHIMVSYNEKDISHITCTVRNTDWLWATRDQYLWSGIALNMILLYFKTLLFHASYIGYNNAGIIFTAPSGTGKSTQAELWRRHRGAKILNGDKVGISLRDKPMAHGVPFSGTSGICENRSLPLKAVVILSQAPENIIRKMAPVEAVTALCPNVFVDKLVSKEWSIALNLLLDLVSQVPVYSLACTPDERAIEALESVLSL